MRALKAGREDGLHQRLAGLEILAADGSFVLARQLVHRRDIDGQVRRAVGERHALLQRGVGVDHRGRDLLVVLASAPSRRLHATDAPRSARCKTSVDPHQMVTRRLAPLDFLKSRMSCAQLLGQIHLVLALLDVGAVDLLDIVVIEHGRHAA